MKRATWVSAGLFAAWVIHDAEELVTAAGNSRELAGRAPAWVPIPPDIRREGLSQRHVNTAIGMMAVLIGAAALDGARSGGRSCFFQTVLRGFGWHGVGHLAVTALTRQYTCGVATAPIVVIPYWFWARRELARDGVPLCPIDVRPMLAVPALLFAAHAIARALTGGPR